MARVRIDAEVLWRAADVHGDMHVYAEYRIMLDPEWVRPVRKMRIDEMRWVAGPDELRSVVIPKLLLESVTYRFGVR